MHNRHIRPAADLHHAAYVSGRNDLRRGGFKCLHFARLELAGNLWLHKIVGAG